MKSRSLPEDLAPGWAAGTAVRLGRCLHPSYRVDLIAPGDPCVLWVSGARNPGVHAVGVAADNPQPLDDASTARAQWKVELDLWRLADPVPRARVMADPDLATAEVLRMPAGSNPSYLSPTGWARLAELVGPTTAGVTVSTGPWGNTRAARAVERVTQRSTP